MTGEPSVLLVGGYGAVGAEAARTLRRRHPHVRLTIAGRDQAKAEALAHSLGNADGIECDLTAPGLGISHADRYRAVAVFAKDDYSNGLDFAIDHGAAYVAVSEYAVEMAPLLARSVGDGRGIPILLLSHHLGGLVTMTTLHYASELAAVTAVRIGAIFDPEDLGGATAQLDAARVARASPNPLLRLDGQWIWAEAPMSERVFRDADGAIQQGTGLSLLDVTSIAAATNAPSVRFDVAVRDPAVESRPRHDVVIEIEGRHHDQEEAHLRIDIHDDAYHFGMSGRTMAFGLERLLGLDGRETPQPGLHLPETMLDAATLIQLTQAHGAAISIDHQPQKSDTFVCGRAPS